MQELSLVATVSLKCRAIPRAIPFATAHIFLGDE
jgi:hypothetical protein